jgi:ferrochelatase
MNEMISLKRFSPASKLAFAPAGHPQIAFGKIGVLLINLGTPDGTSYWPMRRYLKEFLSDRRVIETNPAVWWLVLNLIVLSKRPFSSGEAYRAIWNKELDESPLRTITRSQSEGLSLRLKRDPRIVVDWGMRYGNPSIKSRLEALRAQGCDRILLFPLYPHYSASTSGTACDKAFEALKSMRWQPAIRVVPPYFDDVNYIDALALSMQKHLAGLNFKPDVVLASYHGLPQSYLEKGDPYHCHCMKTTRLLREALGWEADRLITTFQSRFGFEQWLKPYTAETIENLARKGVKNLAVIMPGFSADCIETLEEIAMQGAETFHEHGGVNFAALPCLNDAPESLSMLDAIIQRELSGWAGLK